MDDTSLMTPRSALQAYMDVATPVSTPKVFKKTSQAHPALEDPTTAAAAAAAGTPDLRKQLLKRRSSIGVNKETNYLRQKLDTTKDMNQSVGIDLTYGNVAEISTSSDVSIDTLKETLKRKRRGISAKPPIPRRGKIVDMTFADMTYAEVNEFESSTDKTLEAELEKITKRRRFRNILRKKLPSSQPVTSDHPPRNTESRNITLPVDLTYGVVDSDSSIDSVNLDDIRRRRTKILAAGKQTRKKTLIDFVKEDFDSYDGRLESLGRTAAPEHEGVSYDPVDVEEVSSNDSIDIEAVKQRRDRLKSSGTSLKTLELEKLALSSSSSPDTSPHRRSPSTSPRRSPTAASPRRAPTAASPRRAPTAASPRRAPTAASPRRTPVTTSPRHTPIRASLRHASPHASLHRAQSASPHRAPAAASTRRSHRAASPQTSPPAASQHRALPAPTPLLFSPSASRRGPPAASTSSSFPAALPRRSPGASSRRSPSASPLLFSPVSSPDPNDQIAASHIAVSHAESSIPPHTAVDFIAARKSPVAPPTRLGHSLSSSLRNRSGIEEQEPISEATVDHRPSPPSASKKRKASESLINSSKFSDSDQSFVTAAQAVKRRNLKVLPRTRTKIDVAALIQEAYQESDSDKKSPSPKLFSDGQAIVSDVSPDKGPNDDSNDGPDDGSDVDSHEGTIVPETPPSNLLREVESHPRSSRSLLQSFTDIDRMETSTSKGPSLSAKKSVANSYLRRLADEWSDEVSNEGSENEEDIDVVGLDAPEENETSYRSSEHETTPEIIDEEPAAGSSFLDSKRSRIPSPRSGTLPAVSTLVRKSPSKSGSSSSENVAGSSQISQNSSEKLPDKPTSPVKKIATKQLTLNEFLKVLERKDYQAPEAADALRETEAQFKDVWQKACAATTTPAKPKTTSKKKIVQAKPSKPKEWKTLPYAYHREAFSRFSNRRYSKAVIDEAAKASETFFANLVADLEDVATVNNHSIIQPSDVIFLMKKQGLIEDSGHSLNALVEEYLPVNEWPHAWPKK
ncbi:nascent polypeptide-associated complex subunit alpha, muscle-specific form [Hyalella azteca]|uniref:Nascent polypeptide-associated complex subunit alpha, muscle-specific form n=1 Tax=Hyalella azteca TaxID=294128 RepID=A0A979FHN2_HYAAZ|nr:nascent polypeptide-associated complex subunit alpha, muscle-specific form [Hyalella azteca]